MPLYKNGLPFSSILAEQLKDLQERVDGRKASLVIVDGGVGEGKTTIVVQILDYINKLNGLDPIEIKVNKKAGPQLAIGGVDFLKKIRICSENKLPCVGYDEAGDFSRRGSLTQFNAMINRTFETFRAFKCIVVMALPSFNVLDQDLIDKNIPRLFLHLKDRGKSYGNFQGYSLYRLNWLKYHMSKSKIKTYAFKKVTPNFYGHFLDIEPERSKQLDEVTTVNKLEILRKSEVRIEGLLTYPELATKLFKSVSWVRTSVRNLKIKPQRIIKKIKYFDKHALNELSEHLDIITDNGKRKRGPNIGGRPKGIKRPKK